MKTNLMYVAAALLLVAFTPKAYETTLIQGRIGGGMADQVTAFVLDYVYNQFNGTDFTILGVAVSDKPEDSRAAIRKYALPWEQILGTGNIAMDAYGINGIPQVILFGPDGTILKRDLRGEQIGEAVKEALGL